MINKFLLTISVPQTQVTTAQSLRLTESTGNVEFITCHLYSSGKTPSCVTCEISDPKGAIFNTLPDPAFSAVPIALYLQSPQDSTFAPGNLVKVFDGIVSSYSFAYPAPYKLNIVGHDKSLTIRKVADWKTFKGLNSVQIVKKIAGLYGLATDIDTGDTQLLQHAISMGAPGLGNRIFSDWDHCKRVLSADGLYLYVDKDTIKIRQESGIAYPTTFKFGNPPVQSLHISVNHISVADKKQRSATFGSDGGTKAGTSGATAKEAAAQKAPQVTERAPVGSAVLGSKTTHAESQATSYKNTQTKSKNKKNEMVLECDLLADIGLDNTINMSGYGAKIDGLWHMHSLTHIIVPAQGATKTTLEVKRQADSKAQKQAGVFASQNTGSKS